MEEEAELHWYAPLVFKINSGLCICPLCLKQMSAKMCLCRTDTIVAVGQLFIVHVDLYSKRYYSGYMHFSLVEFGC